jgi:hypothetical protein
MKNYMKMPKAIARQMSLAIFGSLLLIAPLGIMFYLMGVPARFVIGSLVSFFAVWVVLMAGLMRFGR